MGLSPKSNYEKKISFLVLTLGKFLEALGSGIRTGSIFCLSFSLSNRVIHDGVNNSEAQIAFISDMWFLHPPPNLLLLFTKELKINTLHALLSLPHPKIPVHCKICT